MSAFKNLRKPDFVENPRKNSADSKKYALLLNSNHVSLVTVTIPCRPWCHVWALVEKKTINVPDNSSATLEEHLSSSSGSSNKNEGVPSSSEMQED